MKREHLWTGNGGRMDLRGDGNLRIVFVFGDREHVVIVDLREEMYLVTLVAVLVDLLIMLAVLLL